MPDQGLDRAQQAVQAEVAAVLAEVAAEFARSVQQADASGELVAARFNVRDIAGMWAGRIGRILAPLLDAAERAARRIAGLAGAPLPPGWDDLPARADQDPRTLPAPVQDWLREATGRLDAIGDRLAAAARDTLTQGIDDGDTIEQLQARLLARFDADAPGQLSPGRAERIARTEAAAAWHAAALAAAAALPEDARPAAKRWGARSDGATRAAHRAAHGQTVALNETFTVGGSSLRFPADPTGPPDQVINCRCRLQFEWDDRSASAHSQEASPQEFSDRRETHMGQAHHTSAEEEQLTAADGGPHTSSMIALVPTAEDAARLAVDDGLTVDDLHLTLLFLGPADDITDDARDAIGAALAQVAATTAEQDTGPIEGHGFAINAFNPGSDEPAIVIGVSGEQLPAIHATVTEAIAPLMDLPTQYQPWVPHVTLTYDSDLSLIAQYADRVGPIRFDRLRVSYAGQATDYPLTPAPADEPEADTELAADGAPAPNRTWTTPGDAALAYEDQETGDGRIFAPGALYWTEGPWPLQYADQMLTGHDGAELAGSIEHMERDGGRITGRGVLYASRDAGAEAIELLADNAPLGVSVDLDDVDVQFVDRTSNAEGDEPADPAIIATAHLAHMSLLPLPGGAWAVRATHTRRLTAAASGHNALTEETAAWTTGPGGATPRDLIAAALRLDTLTAAAGDADDPTQGTVVHSESTGDILMRITKGRVRGATLVAVPAYDRARIVLDPSDDEPAPATDNDMPAHDDMDLAAAALGEVTRRVIAYVSTAPEPVTARQTAQALGIPIRQARDALNRAVRAGRLRRLARGLYVGAPTLPEEGDLSAAMSGDTSLTIHPDPDYEWDGDQAASRVLEWATNSDGEVDASRLGEAFLYRDPEANPATLAAYKLGMADVIGDELHIVPRAIYAIASVLQGGRGGVDIPDAEQDELRDRVADLYDRLAEALDDPTIRAPWDDDNGEETAAMRVLEASAWHEMRQAPAMPAAWFREPTAEELPPGSGGVHYRDGRIYGWVAQTGEPHAGHPGRNLTIESLGDIDTSHFLRARFQLDNGEFVKVGAFTMNVGHDRDGAETDSAQAQFDDSRTVAGIVTVGLSKGGMWFSGAAAPWLSDWDRQVFLACQPSYHMRQSRTGRWQLRAVLSVPVPGHSSPYTLAASASAAAMVQRSNLALAASAYRPVLAASGPAPTTAPAPALAQAGPIPDVGQLADALVARLADTPAFVASIADAVTRHEEAKRERLAALRARVAAASASAPEPAAAVAA